MDKDALRKMALQHEAIARSRRKPKIKKGDIQYAILSAVALAGVMAMVAVAPNALMMFRYMGMGGRQKYDDEPQKAISRSTKSLIRQGLVRYAKTSADKIEITLKGKAFLCKVQLRDLHYKKPAKWDKKWRIVTFDIKEKQRNKRDSLRGILHRVGFFRLQHSVWVFPYHIEPLEALLKIEKDIGEDVVYIIAEEIENDVFLKKHFNL